MEYTPEPAPHREQHSEQAERIAQAALLFRGKLYTGNHHDEALYKLGRDYPDWEDKYSDEIQEGFTTNAGRFVDRKEAKQIADRADQLLNRPESKGGSDDEMDSYDVNLRQGREYLH